MKKLETNYGFIDGTNLHLTMRYLGWPLDYLRFRRYLAEHYRVATAYYAVGYVAKNAKLYTSLESSGFTMIYKPTMRLKDGSIKGNVDTELVLQAMIDYGTYDKAVIVTSDGDFACLVRYLVENEKLETVLAPSYGGCSSLLKKASGSRIAFIDNLKDKLEYTKKTP